MRMNEKFDVIIPVAVQHVEILMENIVYVKRNLQPQDIYIICSSEVKDNIADVNVKWIDEKDNIPLFNIKTEYHKPYFETMNKLLGIEKQIQGSFVTEHMMVDKYIMIELIQKIEENNEIPGEKFYEKILYSIDNIEDLLKSGFSEFETYGTYLISQYPQNLKFRELKTLRDGKRALGEYRNEKVLEWVSHSYDTISFEKWQPIAKKSYFA